MRVRPIRIGIVDLEAVHPVFVAESVERNSVANEPRGQRTELAGKWFGYQVA
jgi:hypothetical protein